MASFCHNLSRCVYDFALESEIVPILLQAETHSAQGPITENLHSVDTINKLEDLMNQVFARRAKQIPSVPYVHGYIYLLVSVLIIVLVPRLSVCHLGLHSTMPNDKHGSMI